MGTQDSDNARAAVDAKIKAGAEYNHDQRMKQINRENAEGKAEGNSGCLVLIIAITSAVIFASVAAYSTL